MERGGANGTGRRSCGAQLGDLFLTGLAVLLFAMYFLQVMIYAGAGTKSGQVLSLAGEASAMTMAAAVVSFRGMSPFLDIAWQTW